MRPKRIIILLAIALVCGVLLYGVNPSQHLLMPKCAFKALTGWSCPGCGFQRAAHAFFHGHFIEAISYNYYMAYTVPYLLSFLVVWAAPDYSWSGKLKAFIENPHVVYFYVITYFIWLVVRNLLHI